MSPTTLVSSYAEKSFGDPPAGIILYPALGAPEVLEHDSNWIHLLMLLPDMDEDILKLQVYEHLGLYSDLEALRKIKDEVPGIGAQYYRGLTHELQPAVRNLGHIRLLRHDPKSSTSTQEWELRASGWKGFLHEKALKRYRTCQGLEKAIVWEIALEVRGLTGSALQAWDSGKPFYLHWGHPDASKDVQSQALYRILSKATYQAEFSRQRDHDPFTGAETKMQELATRTEPLFVGTTLQAKLTPEAEHRLWKGVVLQAPPIGMPSEDWATMDVHPVYRRTAKQAAPLRIGFLSDLHLVNKFRLLRNCDLHALPKGGSNGAPEGLKTIGKTVQDTVDVLFDLFQQLIDAKDIDAVVIGGDLVDFCEDNWPRNIASLYDPECEVGALACPDLKERKRFEHVWDSCRLDNDPHQRENNQQAGLTTLGFLHLVIRLVKEGGKPVYVLAGNHDSYQAPFGISPRVRAGEVEFARGNEGIAADCNLTIHEAVLAFGKDYGKYFKSNNFTPEVGQLFHLLFNPLRSWTTPFGAHQLLFLDWGDDEDMLWHQDGLLPGHLPHATDACSQSDLELTDAAIATRRPVALFSHFTWACYDPSIPIDDKNRRQRFRIGEDRPIQGNDPQVTAYNVGTCRLGRDAMFEHFLEGKIRLAVSGHAHRASLYVLEGKESSLKGGRVRDGEFPKTESLAKVCAWHFDELGWVEDLITKPRTIFVVSDSAGPIPRENRGLLDGWGSRKASWTWLSIRNDGVLNTIESRATHAMNSLPRLAVSLDYVEYKRCGSMRWVEEAEDAQALVQALHEPTKAAQQSASSWGQKILKVVAKTVEKPSPKAIAKELKERAKEVREKASAAKATLKPDSSAPAIDPVTSSKELNLKEVREHFGHDSKILSNFVSEPISNPDKLTSIHFFHNPDAITLPEGARIGKVSLFVWEGMEVEALKDADPSLKESWLRLAPGQRHGEWIASATDNASSWDALKAVLSDGKHEHASTLFVCIEFEGHAEGYDIASPWVVYAQWEDQWVNNTLGRRIRIFRNVVAHENPDHEIWRLAEYEDDAKLGSMGDVK